MKPDKAPGYWPMRILLAVAIIATAIVVAFALWSAFWAPPTFGGAAGPNQWWELPDNIALVVLAAATAVIGLIWTIRIFRGPRDDPPPWRHRDR
jgi:NADH:ubiquinone oxidoreductase subunit 5 (subunit L)/multisubunit Na+/H+ antiporter MnhA subunit